MRVFIVDASVAAKWFIEEEYSEAALSVLNAKNQLHAPDFLLLELDSIICKWIKRNVVTISEGGEVRDAFRQYPIQHHPFTTLLDPSFMIASRTGQSIYDCLYVALATILDSTMLTADRRLYEGLKNGPLKKHIAWLGDIKPQ